MTNKDKIIFHNIMVLRLKTILERGNKKQDKLSFWEKKLTSGIS